MTNNYSYILDAVKSFADLPRPTKLEQQSVEELILANLHRLDSQRTRSICAVLAESKTVSESLLAALCALPAPICHPLLLSNHVLPSEKLIPLLNANIQKARIVARRTTNDQIVSDHLRALQDHAVDRALDLRQKSAAEPEIGDAPTTETLIGEQETLKLHLVEAIEDENDTVVRTAFADALGLGAESINALCSDPTSRNLPTALHFLQLDDETAWLAYQRLTAPLASNQNVKVAFAAVYQSLDRSETKSIISQWQIDELVAIVRCGKNANIPMAEHTAKRA